MLEVDPIQSEPEPVEGDPVPCPEDEEFFLSKTLRMMRLHHAGLSHIAKMIANFGSEDKYILCADGKV